MPDIAKSPLATAPKSPGATLAELLAGKGMNQGVAASRLNLTRPYLNQVLNDKRAISPDLRTKLKSVLGIEPEFWDAVQQTYAAWKTSPEGREHFLSATRESLYNILDLHGPHVLMADEILEALRGGAIELRGFDAEHEEHRSRLKATTLWLTFSNIVYADGDVLSRFSDTFTLAPGKMAKFVTQEDIVLQGRVRAVVHGIIGDNATQPLQLFCERVREPMTGGQITFGLLNLGTSDITITAGEECLAISFDYLAQDHVLTAE